MFECEINHYNDTVEENDQNTQTYKERRGDLKEKKMIKTTVFVVKMFLLVYIELYF